MNENRSSKEDVHKKVICHPHALAGSPQLRKPTNQESRSKELRGRNMEGLFITRMQREKSNLSPEKMSRPRNGIPSHTP